MSIKRKLIEKLHNNKVQIWKQSEKSYQGKIYLGWKGGTGGQPIYKYKTIKTDDITVVRKEIEKMYHKNLMGRAQNGSKLRLRRETNLGQQIWPFPMGVKVLACCAAGCGWRGSQIGK